MIFPNLRRGLFFISVINLYYIVTKQLNNYVEACNFNATTSRIRIIIFPR